MAVYRAGQPITRISAGLLNDAAALVDRTKRDGAGFSVSDSGYAVDRSYIRVQNHTGAPRQRFDVVGLGAPVIKRGANASEFFSRVMLRAVAPDVDKAVAVLLTPLAVMGIGRAVVSGAVYARAKINAETDRAVTVLPNEYRLQTAAAGERTLWIEPLPERDVPAEGWVVAVLGSGSPAAVATAVITGYTDSNRKFVGLLLDGDGAPTGDPITIHAYSGGVGAVQGDIGAQDLTKCNAPVVGGTLRIQQQAVKIHSGVVSGWFAVDMFTLSCVAG